VDAEAVRGDACMADGVDCRCFEGRMGHGLIDRVRDEALKPVAWVQTRPFVLQRKPD
jgi:hypothetical protein